MKNAADSIRRSIIKRQEAMEKFQERKREFLNAKEQIIKDIEEARTILFKFAHKTEKS
jgi:hypothetical protein